jgi:hypothetical protein
VAYKARLYKSMEKSFDIVPSVFEFNCLVGKQSFNFYTKLLQMFTLGLDALMKLKT